jgi:gluconokinase
VHTGLYVIMGVSGSGKTTIGTALARALDVPFVEGDQLHPRANVERMARGIPLTDEDRQPWLIAIAQRLREADQTGSGLVIACSALKRSYRDLLRSRGSAKIRFVYLRGDQSLVADRLKGRHGHFMPASLLESQFAALEEPDPKEHVLVCDIGESPAAIVDSLVQRVT